MNERLQKIIASSGYCSRRKAEELIIQGLVKVNGKTACLGDSADIKNDHITINDICLNQNKKSIYIMLHKPRGYVTTLSDEKGRHSVIELVKDIPYRIYPIGRLDMYSEGLLLLTNDGDVANKIMHPSHDVTKKYEVISNDNISDEQIDQLSNTIIVDDVPVKAVSVKRGEDALSVYVEISEGKNRQIRKMCDFSGIKVVRLIRLQEGQLTLGNLKVGKWRYLSAEEIEYLKKIKK